MKFEYVYQYKSGITVVRNKTGHRRIAFEATTAAYVAKIPRESVQWFGEVCAVGGELRWNQNRESPDSRNDDVAVTILVACFRV